MATPIIDNLLLPANRFLVLLDEGSNCTGIIQSKSAQGYRRFIIPQEPVDPSQPSPTVQEYDHVLFVKEMAETVEVNGVAYIAIHGNAIVGLIPD